MTKHTVAQVENIIATEDDAEVSAMLRAYATLLAEKENNGTTHWNGTTHYAGCVGAGPKHYECAVRELAACSAQFDRQQQQLDRNAEQIATLRAELEKKTWFSAYEKKEWVGLTDDEIEHLRQNAKIWWNILEAAEAKLKEKNGG